MADEKAGTNDTARRFKEARGLVRLAARVASLEGRVGVIETQNLECATERSQLVANTDEILSVVKGAKSVQTFLKKNAGRIGTAILGYLVISGKLPKEASDLISKIFNF